MGSRKRTFNAVVAGSIPARLTNLFPSNHLKHSNIICVTRTLSVTRAVDRWV